VANEYVPIKSNAIVEEHLGSKGLICIDDLVTQLLKGGEYFYDQQTAMARSPSHSETAEPGATEATA